jgi:hypothetical protein
MRGVRLHLMGDGIMTDEKDHFENLRREYAELNHNHRHYSNLRHGALALYLVVLSGLLYFSYGGGTRLNVLSWWDTILRTKALALLLTALFFAFDIFCELTMRRLGRVASELEGMLGFRQFRVGSFSPMRWAAWLIWVMYVTFLWFWMLVQTSP